MRASAVRLALGAAGSFTTAPAHASGPPAPPPPPPIVSFSGGLGVGGFTLGRSEACPRCTVSSPALSLSGRVGWRLHPAVVLGAAAEGQLEDIDGVDGDNTYASIFAAYAYAQLMPLDDVFVFGGLGYGLGQYHATHTNAFPIPGLSTTSEDATTIGSGVAALAGAGYVLGHLGTSRIAIAVELAFTRIALGDAPATYATALELTVGSF